MGPFRTFLMGGFECADHINRAGDRVNLLRETQHDIRADEDYALLKSVGIAVVREGICWSAVEHTPGVYDFSEVHHRMKMAEKHGIQQIWDLIHFGYPDGIYPTHPLFCKRFENLCHAFASFYRQHSKQQLFVVPINEISFLSWHSGDMRGTVPFMVGAGWDIKYHLCKAAIIGINALKLVDPECRIVLVEPMISVHRNPHCTEEELFHFNENQFQAMDIIAGRMCPELGGSEEFLDILGFNYYWNCQWVMHADPLPWPEETPRRVSVADMFAKVYARYKKPIFLSETGHFGVGRKPWIEEIARECRNALQAGVPLLGACIYPVTDRPDWDDLNRYFNCGIWDLDDMGNRIAHGESIEAIRNAQAIVGTPQHQHEKLIAY